MSRGQCTTMPRDRAVLVTGAAGFIGHAVSRRLVADGHAVVGIDNLDPYYDVALKEARLADLAGLDGFRFERRDLADAAETAQLFRDHTPHTVIHLAAQPGVRHSLVDPGAYGRANLTGFLHVLEGCRAAGTAHLVYASSSSVYGADATPFRTTDSADRPLNLYGATKKANELMAHAYASLFGIAMTGLRFFTVYGPWGRPDMAVYAFTRAIAEGRPIALNNAGEMQRDFTYVDDIVEGVLRAAARPPSGEAGAVPARIYNIGSDAPVPLRRLVALIEAAFGRTAVIEERPMQPGEAVTTWADIGDLERDTGFRPVVPIEEGIRRFVAWYRAYHGA